ncbi:unnamed protein product [Staurois parvus]|uniref:Sulfotransferase n=1 Tax=Staurois parvus TaxID=386267 RepID=A0ABN9DSV3_9NEOB|nr:unnamed protein product [Staurois parvus]
MRKCGAIFFVVTAVITLQTIILVLNNLGTRFSNSLPREKPSKVHLLILSTWRAGSSLVGQIFNQNPDVFYLKEPAWHVWNTMPHNNAHVLHMAVRDLIRSVFKCDMSVLDVYMQNRSYVSNLFQWSSSRALCLPPACNTFSRKKIVTDYNCKKYCAKSPFSKVEQSCNAYSHIVLQEVRIFDLKVLYPLLKDPSLNLKILHLVRDPRAVAKSRIQTFRALAVDNGIVLNRNGTKINDTKFLALHEICQSHANMYKMATDDPPLFLNGRYMMVRYEDLVQDPLGKVQEIYKFANLEMTEKLSEWICNVTHGQGLPTRKEAFKITSRNALNVSQAWRTMLPFQIVTKIQDICKDAMNTFQYQFMKSETQQRDLSEDFVLPRTKH